MIDRLSRAGTEKQLLLTLEQLDRDKVQPYLCLLDGTDQLSTELLPNNCDVLRLGVKKLLSPSALRQACRFWRYLRNNQIDVVQMYFPDSTRFAAPVARAAGVRQIFGARRDTGYWFRKPDYFIARLYNKLFLDGIIANSEAARQSAILQERIAPNRVMVISNTIDLEPFKRITPWRQKPAGTPQKVGMVGNLRPVKGPDLFIRAAQLVLQYHCDTQFEIAGGGDPTPYQQLIDELGLSKSVRLLGSVTDIPAFLETLDVAVLPSRAEGLSNALLEYMAAGRPIVATNVGGNEELITHEQSGILIDPDALSISSAIVRLLSTPEDMLRLSAEAAQSTDRFDVTAIADTLCECYFLFSNRPTQDLLGQGSDLRIQSTFGSSLTERDRERLGANSSRVLKSSCSTDDTI